MYVRFTSNGKYFYPFKEIPKIRIIARPILLSKKRMINCKAEPIFRDSTRHRLIMKAGDYQRWKHSGSSVSVAATAPCKKPLFYLSFSSFSNFKMIWIPLNFAPKKSLVVSQDIMWERSIIMLRLVTEKTDLMVLIPQNRNVEFNICSVSDVFNPYFRLTGI